MTRGERRRPGQPARRRRRLLAAVAVAAAVVALVLLGLDLHRRWPPSSSALAQMRRDAVVWQAALAPRWPSAYADDLKLPPAVVRALDARERSQLASVETQEMLHEDLAQSGIAELMTQARRLNPQEPREPVETLWQRRVVSFRFARRDLDGAIVCDALIWSGSRLARWDSRTKRFVPARRFDVEPLYELVFRRDQGRWRLDAAAVLRYSVDTSSRYGPSTPHRLLPPGWAPVATVPAATSASSRPASSPSSC